MPFIHEIQIVSTGFPGAPGYTNLYFEFTIGQDPNDQFTAVKAFLDTISGNFPTTWSGQIQPNGRVLLAETGALAEFTTAPPSAVVPVSGAQSGGFGAGVAGIVIGWQTATVNRARLVRGRTFVVPLAAQRWEPDGTPSALAVTQMNLAGQALLDADMGFVVWSRPRAGAGGVGAPVIGFHVNDSPAFLTSRRA